MPPTTTAIDPKNSLRGQQITPGTVDSNVAAKNVNFTPVSAIDPVAAQKIAGMAGTGPVGYNAAQAQTAGGGERLGVNVGTSSVKNDAMSAFNAQLPGMNIDFADQSDQLAKRTSAMGRTGSGLFNRDTGYISDRSRASRESMLGNLSFTAAQTDAANRLQASIETGRLREQQEGRFANTNVANMQSANQLSGLNAGNELKAAQGNQDLAGRMGMADADNALRAAMANQQTASNMGQFNAQGGLDASRFNATNDMTAQMENVQNDMRNRDFNSNFLSQERGYQDQLAAQAQNDLWKQMAMFQNQGWSGDPSNTIMQAGQNIGNISGEYGANANQINQQIGGGTQALYQMLMQGGYGGQQQPQGQPQQQPYYGPNNFHSQATQMYGGVAGQSA